MSFTKRGDAEIIEIIKESKPNDKETAEALDAVKKTVIKNTEETGNKIGFNIEYLE
jgi:hypothetical protein